MEYRHFYRIFLPLAFLLLIVVVGVAGYMIIEDYGLLDAFYMTVITVATVGFQEVHPLDGPGRLFTAFLIITSFGTFAYAVSSISKYLADGEFRTYLKKRRVSAAIDKLENHVIICGFGRNGRQAAHVLKKHDTRFVVIEEKKDVVEGINHRYSDLVLEGNATSDEVLERAGILRARALITTLPTDADNLFIVLSAKTLNPKLTIISRASEDSSDKKLKLAGADNVIMPDKVGGAHMASLVMKPDVMEFVDFITGQGGDNIRLEEITFDNLSEEFRNKSIRELEVRNRSGANIIGFKTANGEYIINPNADTRIIPDAKLFVLGTTDQITKLKELFV
jgi:voltage-gated potassium channel